MTKHFHNHSKHRSSALRTDRRLRTIAGRLVCELRRNLKGNSIYENLLMLFEQVLSQRVKSKSKIYSLNEPQIVCISKGKKHKKYEFVNKVSIILSANSIIQGTWSFRNEYDRHTIKESLNQVERITDRKIKRLAGDMGYRAKKK